MPPSKKSKKKINKNKELINLFYIVSVVLLLLLSIYNLESVTNKISGVLGVQNEVNERELVEEKLYWEEFLSTNPTYYDGWYKLAEIEFLLGNLTSSITFREFANRIDANH
ncbi:hypothetical protein ISR94_03130 [Candidatus Microgenomates bacterium]|nr:hypothetical protein [Candidatus Microgenomates bacterium]